ncbi:helix-turn-helix transcriptional regulator [Ferruginibacter sp.]
MKVFFSALGIFLFINSYNGYCQTNFEKEYSVANPVKHGDTILIKEKIDIHQAYLQKAIENKNVEQQFYGHLYLWSDYLEKNYYEEATLQLFSADSIAQQTGNLSWQAAVHGKRGILDFELNDIESALKNFILTLQECSKTKDSSCLAFNLKEIGLAYQRLQNYDSAKHYYALAIPLIRKYTDSNKLYAYYSNYSNLLSEMGDYPGAKKYLDSSIAIIMTGKNLFKQLGAKNNLAALLVKMGEYDKALKILEECIVINKQHGWYEQLSHNYANMSIIFNKKGDYHAAFTYLQDYYSINDSIRGAELQIKMVNLNTSRKVLEKELALEKSLLEISIAKNTIQKRTWTIITVGLLLIFILLTWLSQRRKAKRKQAHTLGNLEQLTRILMEKNSLLAALEEKVSKPAFTIIAAANSLAEQTSAATEKFEQAVVIEEEKVIESERYEKPDEVNDFEKNIYNQRILTPADWSAFKIYFEKAFPGYLLRLRNAHPKLTEAEERLFLFIKLKLTNKEAAAILGISADSVKKTRTRLRKRLDIHENIDLETYISTF